MTARPILFSPPMARALLDGRKTQTRRKMKDDDARCLVDFGIQEMICPYGRPGDLLWVRETFGTRADCPSSMVLYQRRLDLCAYRADAPEEHSWCWKPSIHMPRWASRLTLEITSVRVERLKAISEEDAYAEGIFDTAEYDNWYCSYEEDGAQYCDAKTAYQHLWQSINGPGSWDANPWVWVLEFKVHRCNVDEYLKRMPA